MMDKDGMSPRKSMASGDGGNFGCEPMSNYSKAHPDANSGVHKKTMSDDDRGAGKPVKHSSGKHAAQANPDHGPHRGAHGPEFGRAGKR